MNSMNSKTCPARSVAGLRGWNVSDIDVSQKNLLLWRFENISQNIGAAKELAVGWFLDLAIHITNICCLCLWYSSCSHAICLARCLEIPSMNCFYADWNLLFFELHFIHLFGTLCRRDSKRGRRWINATGLHNKHGCTVHLKTLWTEDCLMNL